MNLVDGTNENKVLINADYKSVANVEKEQEDSDDNDQTFKLSDVAKFYDALKVAQDKAKGDIGMSTVNWTIFMWYLTYN